jgi:hypothetical protein
MQNDFKHYLRLLQRICPDAQSAASELKWMLKYLTAGRIGCTMGSSEYDHGLPPRLHHLVHQRVFKAKPLQYILRSQPFCGLDIIVRKPVLIPRYVSLVYSNEWMNG